jgi:hypothetical protein
MQDVIAEQEKISWNTTEKYIHNLVECHGLVNRKLCRLMFSIT